MPNASAKPEWTERARKEGRYLLGPRLGSGGMGDVHEAWDTLLGRTVALKVLTRMEPSALIRFMHEAQLQARLHHPNICEIYDIEVYEGAPRIAMQLVKGPDLEDASPELELGEIVAICAQVADGLHHAHRHGLVHRDVKPGNVLLQWVDDAWKPVIVDFGLAMAVNESGLTLPNALTGTPAYMAPEQVRGDRSHVGPHSDVYGLGGTLYFLLVGRPPCVSTVTREMVRIKREQRFPRPRSLEPSIPGDLERILLRCLAPDPADRYPTMDLLARDLRAFQVPAPGQRPRRLGLAVGLAALVLALAGAGLAGVRRSRQRALRETVATRADLEVLGLTEAWNRSRGAPAHDLRPDLARLQDAIQSADSRFAVPGDRIQASARLVEGTARLCAGDPQGALTALDAAWRGGRRSPLTAYLAQASAWRAWMAEAEEAAFNGLPAPSDRRDQARFWMAHLSGVRPDRLAIARGSMAYMDGDDDTALAQARACMAANPYRVTGVWLGCQALHRKAGALERAQDGAGAARLYREALAWATEALHWAPSDPELHHASVQAREALLRLDLAQGRASRAEGGALFALAEAGLRLNPADPMLQADWLRAKVLEARICIQAGSDAGPSLREAMAFYWTRTREPRPAALRGAHMILYTLAAEQEAAQGRSPHAALQEAWKNAGHVLEGPTDHLERLQRFGNYAGPAAP